MSNKELVASPLSFGLSLVLLLSLGASSLDPAAKGDLYCHTSFVISLIVLSWLLMKVFATLDRENTLEVLITQPFRPTDIMISLALPMLIVGLVTTLVLNLLLGYFVDLPEPNSHLTEMVVCLTIYLTGLIPLGILCCTLTQSSPMLFPIIYFPLATPLTLVTIQSFKVLWQSPQLSSEALTPFGTLMLLGVFFAIISGLLFHASLE